LDFNGLDFYPALVVNSKQCLPENLIIEKYTTKSPALNSGCTNKHI